MSAGRVEAVIFLGTGAYLVVASVVYGVLSSEPAGTVMLALAGALGLFIGAYLRRSPGLAEDDRHDGFEPYLPHASIWPFAIGMASLLVAHGLALGLWALLPGVVLLGAGMLGFSLQSRHRE